MNNNRVLWVNPSFLDYRIPLYKELYRLHKENFYLIYSKLRVPKRCIDKVELALGTHAIGLSTEKILSTTTKEEFANRGISIPFPKGLYLLIKNVQADVIIAEGFFQFTPWAVTYKILHRKKLIIAYERTAHTERNCPLWRKLYRRFVGLFVDAYIVNGSLTQQYLISQGVKNNQIFPGAMCADSSELSRKVSNISPKQRINIQKKVFGCIPSGISFVYVGRMISLKGVFHLLQGWLTHTKQYANDRLLLVGDGPELQKLKNQVHGLNSVIFAGGVDYSLIHQYYAISDVFVIPTLEDNWSLVVPEAMACGLPIACSIYNGCYPELVHENENGKLFNPLDHTSVVDVLSYFHTVNLKEFGDKSKEIESQFSPTRTAENISLAIEFCLNSLHKQKLHS